MSRVSSSSLRRRIALVTATFAVVLLLIIALHTDVFYGHGFNESTPVVLESGNYSLSSLHRKLLINRAEAMEPDRIWGDKCTKSDIVINQGPTAPLPSGIPTYTVVIMNACVTGCDISGIHLSCGWFSSARLINPRIFKRLRYDDCLVNDGKPLINGRAISFQYANTYSYPLSVSKFIC